MSDIFEILTVSGSHVGFFEESVPFDFDDETLIIRKIVVTPEVRMYIEAIRLNKTVTEDE
jgi:hypothetical protein